MSTHFEQVKSALDRFSGAWKTSDGTTVASFFVADGSLITPFGQRADGRVAIAAMYSTYFQGMLGGTSAKFSVGDVRDVGSDHAFVDAEQTITAPDGTVVLVVHVAALMRRDGDGWRFVDSRPYTFATVPA